MKYMVILDGTSISENTKLFIQNLYKISENISLKYLQDINRKNIMELDHTYDLPINNTISEYKIDIIVYI